MSRNSLYFEAYVALSDRLFSNISDLYYVPNVNSTEQREQPEAVSKFRHSECDIEGFVEVDGEICLGKKNRKINRK